MKPRYAVVLLGAWLATVSDSAAADTYWSSIATACTPDHLSIQNDRYDSPNDAYVAPNGTKLDPIVLICGVQRNAGASQFPNRLSMTYQDSTGRATAAGVLAQLIRVNRTSGTRVLVTTVNSNTFSSSVVTKSSSPAFSHPLNFEASYYYVRIEMDRAAASHRIRAVGVALERQ
jgi:hypothetical protein